MLDVILKADDFWGPIGQWRDYLALLNDFNLKGAFGVTGAKSNAKTCLRLVQKEHELFNHGWDHKKINGKREFKRDYRVQKKRLEKTQNLFRKHGIVLRSFGAPGNQVDGNTAKVLLENPDIKVWLFGRKFSFLDGQNLLVLYRSVNVEYPPPFTVNSKKFMTAFTFMSGQNNPLTLQVHPSGWSSKCFPEFEKIIKFLLERNCRFTTPYRYFKKQTELSS